MLPPSSLAPPPARLSPAPAAGLELPAEAAAGPDADAAATPEDAVAVRAGVMLPKELLQPGEIIVPAAQAPTRSTSSSRRSRP